MCTYAVGIKETEQRNAEISFVVAVFKQEHCEVLPFQFEIGTLGDCPAGLPTRVLLPGKHFSLLHFWAQVVF